MKKKLAVAVQLKLRFSERLRGKLERAAAKSGVSMNSEILHRLDRSFDLDAARTFEQIAGDMWIYWDRLASAFHQSEMLDELVQAANSLVEQLENGNANDQSAAAVKKLRNALRLAEQSKLQFIKSSK